MPGQSPQSLIKPVRSFVIWPNLALLAFCSSHASLLVVPHTLHSSFWLTTFAWNSSPTTSLCLLVNQSVDVNFKYHFLRESGSLASAFSPLYYIIDHVPFSQLQLYIHFWDYPFAVTLMITQTRSVSGFPCMLCAIHIFCGVSIGSAS